MKKTILLLVSAIAISAATFAQRNDGRNDIAMNTSAVIKDNGSSSAAAGTYYFKVTDKNLRVMKINKRFDNLVKSVKDISYISADVKASKVAALEAKRRTVLNKVNAKFFNAKNLADHSVKWTNDVYDMNRHNF